MIYPSFSATVPPQGNSPYNETYEQVTIFGCCFSDAARSHRLPACPTPYPTPNRTATLPPSATALPTATATATLAGDRHREPVEDFSGLWLIDQPAHALYEATLYNFEPGGTLQMVETMSLGYGDDYVTGTVSRSWPEGCLETLSCPAEFVSCHFGDRWRSPGPAQLLILGQCSDGLQREIVFTVMKRTVPNGWVFYAPFVETVGGEAGWDHNTFYWVWQRCPTRAECQLPDFIN